MNQRPTVFANATLLDPEAEKPRAGSLLVQGGRIAEVLEAGALLPDATGVEVIDCAGRAVAPGFIDLHFHGELIFHRPEEFAVALERDRRRMLVQGVTAFLPTTISWPRERLGAAVEALAEVVATPKPAAGAVPLGLHLEGPWISSFAAGAQPPTGIRPYDPSEGAEVLAGAAGAIKMLTLAPEVEGAGRLIADLLAQDVVVALGHSRASEDIVDDAVERGATHVTHLWNAMGKLHHREPSFLGSVLVEDRLTCDLICDGVHVHPRAVALAARAKGDGLALITDRIQLLDAAAEASCDPRRYTDDGQAIRLDDGTLAGSSLTLDRALRNVQEYAGWSLLQAVAACTCVPAKILGIENERGTLRPGARADLVLLDEEARVVGTWLAGSGGP